MILAYFGPETVLPLASVVAAAFGVVMMFGRMSLKILLSPLRWLGRAKRSTSAGSAMRGPTAWRQGANPSRRESVATEHCEES
ncbi:MAG: hypothetical protein JWN86_2556 [Planctomycetota bacterium]|nr:hypothetical protein [Planctomycetota bacterium]